MNNHEIIKKINQTLSYLRERKDYLFNQIQQMKQELENLIGEIHEKETYMELENKKEQQVSNIFNLYDTTNKHAEEKKILAEKIASMNVEKDRLEILIEVIQKEFDRINENIISNQVLVRHFSGKKGQKNLEVIRSSGVKEEKQLEKSICLDINDRLKFCMEILDLDKERCRMELQNLIQELEE